MTPPPVDTHPFRVISALDGALVSCHRTLAAAQRAARRCARETASGYVSEVYEHTRDEALGEVTCRVVWTAHAPL